MCELSLDQRALDADVLADMLAKAKEASERIAAEEGCEVSWERIWQIEPIPFDGELIDMADAVIEEVAGTSHRLPSGPLHDAAEMARVIPTVMLFVKSLRGLSHTKEEDTPVEDLELSVRALDAADAQSARVGGLSMDFGVTFQTDPPASRVVELTQRAEGLGFGYAWTFDSHILWQEPYVIYSQMLAATEQDRRRPVRHQPGHARPHGHRLALRDAERHVRQPHHLRHRARRLLAPGARPQADDAGRDRGGDARHQGARRGPRDPDAGRRGEDPVGARRAACEVWMAAYGPKALALCGRKADGFILQLADPDITRWTVRKVREAAEEAGRDPEAIAVCVAAPAYVGDDLDHAREQCRWFGGMVGNHVADIVKRYGEGGDIPRALTDYIKAREGYDYSHHGRVGNPDTEFVPDEIVERFCVLGTVDDHVAKLRELEGLGVDQFNIYLMHDAMDATLDAYGSDVIPAMAGRS